MDPNTFDQYIEEVKKVTIEDVQRVAREYMKPDQMQMLVVGNAEEMGDQLNKYGNVNEIDITIPEPGSGQMADMGDTEKGKELLKKMTSALISNDTELKTLTMEGTQVVNTAMGERKMETKSTLEFETGNLKQVVNLPQGQMTFVLEGNSGKMMMMGQERPLPPAQIKEMRALINRSYLSIARNADQISAGFVGMTEHDGEEYAQLTLQIDKPVTMLVDAETNLPHLMRYQRFDPQTGKQVKVEERYSNWKKVDGIYYAFKEVSYNDGKQSVASTVKSVKIN
jgi:hypothetical protein